ncbi:ABC transporter ATP-binding protein [Corynebacterium glutamicum ATCC 14067]|uniref:dipeptide ABC transporter ATP-binding protein n=1 Tax=Corynebacterium TaxID=1716 RepID=UPI000231946E|nr:MULTISPECIES: ABC transporter ATP-binding protein [Corynebacterium]KEI23848.1 ABC transporter ATP-binding protein [Corynebacterium glutamicum ATCC 14067]QJS16460.1 ABC transporter ATP-binding protein [Corynebacterium glutamicum]QXU44989.1 ABC transporter ATP-binding protein [[Brevibacterium] flavum]
MLKVSDLTVGNNFVHNVSFEVNPGERVGIIGESGSGKSLTALSIMGLTDLPTTGQITFNGKPSATFRGTRIAMVFQEPMSALNPLMRIGRQIEEMMTLHGASKKDARARLKSLLIDVSLPERTASAYPHELSGGQRQRALIAMALANDPDLLICDEPTTALDVVVQKQIVDLLLRLTKERGTALLFITHDLGLIARTCERLLVMKSGEIVERGDTEVILRSPAHSYTQQLLDASILDQPEIATDSGAPVVIDVEEASKRFKETTALHKVSLAVRKGDLLGIVGGSGSGKTTLLKLIAGLDKPTTGTVAVAGGVQMVFQDPQSSLNPRMKIKDIVAEPLLGWNAAEKTARVAEVITQVGLSPDVLDRYPHEFSGGQRQRISIARALAIKPAILLADEPVSALDVSVRKQVLDLLQQLVEEYGITLVFVSHDLAVVRHLCTTVWVMEQGRVLEQGPIDSVYDHPQTEYTKELLDAVPRLSL